MTSVTDLMRLHTHLGAQWVAGLTRNVEVVSFEHQQCPPYFLEQETTLIA